MTDPEPLIPDRDKDKHDVASVECIDVASPGGGGGGGHRSNPSAVELAADKFNQYLKEEGLDAVAALRARRNETGASAHELFSRCAKSLVLSGSPSEAQGDRLLGSTLELVAQRNPYAIRAGDGVNFLQGAPGSNVTANGNSSTFSFLPTPNPGWS